jgi:hypothetical protein
VRVLDSKVTVELITVTLMESNERFSRPSKSSGRARRLAGPAIRLPRVPPPFDRFLRDHQLGFDVRDIPVLLRSFKGVWFLGKAREASSAVHRCGSGESLFDGTAFETARCGRSIVAGN